MDIPRIAIESPLAALNSALPMLSLSASVELAWLLGGARQLIRLNCSELQLDDLLKGLAALGVQSHPCEGRLFPQVQASLGGYGFGGRQAPGFGRSGGQVLVFVARSEAQARAACRLNDAQDDEALGAALCYPPCCVSAFMRNRSAHMVGFDALFVSGSGPWPWWSNALLASFGWLPVSHLPCMPDCEPTGMRAAAHQSALERFDAPFAAFMRSRLASLVGWHPALGIALRPRNGTWTACGDMRHYLRADGLALDPELAGQCQWIDHGAVP